MRIVRETCRRLFRLGVLGVPLAAVLLAARATGQPLLPPIQSLVVFGDQLSDAGRVNGQPDTDGAVWIAPLAAALGVPVPAPYDPVLRPAGRNFAHLGATAGSLPGPWPSATAQLDSYLLDELAGGAVAPDALHVVWIGTNDLVGYAADPATTADTVSGQLLRLAAAGARYLLVANLPRLGALPVNAADPETWDARSRAFADRLATHLVALRGAYPQLQVVAVDMDGLFGAIVADPGAYGLSDVVSQAQFVPALDPATALWWNATSPTSAGHALVATHAREAILAQLTFDASSVRLTLEPGAAGLRVRLRGPALGLVRLEASTDLQTWTAVATFPAFDGDEAVDRAWPTGTAFFRTR